MNFFLTFITLFLIGCSTHHTKGDGNEFSSFRNYKYNDLSGSFNVSRTSGFKKSKNAVFIKSSVNESSEVGGKPLERKTVISNLGILKADSKNMRVLRPYSASHEAWLEGIKHQSKMVINPQKRTMEVESRVGNENFKKESIKFPKTNGIFCFFSQLVECAKASYFLQRAVRNQSGKMNLTLIWDNYPFTELEFQDVSKSLFSAAELVYDGQITDKEHRFKLEVNDQSIFYVINKKYELEKFSWINQGITQTSQNDQ
jgi:hypothetical protein